MKKGFKQEMIVAGVMSGTSADGINVALVRMGTKRGSGGSQLQRRIPFELLGHAEYPYPRKVRAAILQAMNSRRASVADLSRLNFLLGELYSEAILATQKLFKLTASLIGCHGQTLYHQGERQLFFGRRIAATWQIGEGAVVAARVGVPVVSDFRPADMAAGGKGAPLVPFLDYMLFRDPHFGRILQNIGGIANLTAIPAGATADKVIAFDTGPGNMVIDAITEKLFHRPFDKDGRIAGTGKILDEPLRVVLRRSFFREAPPKTAGREEFGREFAGEFLKLCGRCCKEDAVATATALTAKSVTQALRAHVHSDPHPKSPFHEFILSGGGAKNSTLVAMLTAELSPLGLRVKLSDEFGLPLEAKEAAAFALLAYETWHRRPSNIPSATGAARPAVLGKISYP